MTARNEYSTGRRLAVALTSAAALGVLSLPFATASGAATPRHSAIWAARRHGSPLNAKKLSQAHRPLKVALAAVPTPIAGLIFAPATRNGPTRRTSGRDSEDLLDGTAWGQGPWWMAWRLKWLCQEACAPESPIRTTWTTEITAITTASTPTTIVVA